MKKIVIIGGGIAGLSASVYAQKNGFEAVIYEKNPIMGGQCTGWTRDGYHIDNCIHWLTGTQENTPLRKVWEDVGALGSDTEIIHPDSFFTIELDGNIITLWHDLERTRTEMLALSPTDADEIN